MIIRIFFALLLTLGIVPKVTAESISMFKSVTLYTMSPDRESPIALGRQEVLPQWDKKIELGLGPTYRFSRLFGMLLSASDGRVVNESTVEAPHIIVIAVREDGSQVELNINLHNGMMAIKGSTLRDGDLYKEVIRFLVKMAGERLPAPTNP